MHPQTGGDIWALPLVGKPEPYPVVRTLADEHYARWSPLWRLGAALAAQRGDAAQTAPYLEKALDTMCSLGPELEADRKAAAEAFYAQRIEDNATADKSITIIREEEG